MNKTDKNKVEKSVIDAIINQRPGSPEWARAMTILDRYEDREQKKEKLDTDRQRDEQRFEEDKRRYDFDRKDRLEREHLEREESRYRYDTDRKDRLAKEEREHDLNERKFAYQQQHDAVVDTATKKANNRCLLKDIFCALIGAGAAIGGTVVAYNMYDKQTTKAFQFEETGTVTSNTGKGIIDGMKPPKK